VKRLFQAVLVLLTLYVIASLAAGIFLAEASMKHTRTTMRETYREAILERVALHHARLSNVQITAADGAILRAWYAEPASPNGQAVALFHGVTDTRAGVAGFGELFLEHGYAILLPDSRHHGESGGELATYGVLEADDIARWAHWLQARNAGCVYGFGESMGAGLVLQSLRVDPGFCAVIAESPFSDFRQAAYDRLSDRTGLPHTLGTALSLLPTELGILYTRIRYGIDLDLASPRNAVAHSRTPVLLIHGDADRNLLPENSARILRARATGTQLWSVPGAAHCGDWATTGEEFSHRVLGYFHDHAVPLRASAPLR
jgi:fermentation-respiration switch protein FrsA (DUF1100 family)